MLINSWSQRSFSATLVKFSYTFAGNLKMEPNSQLQLQILVFSKIHIDCSVCYTATESNVNWKPQKWAESK
jgi:hypothetical protein